MKKRLIDATPFEVYTGMVPDGFDENSYIAGCKEIMAKIWAAPTVDAEPVRHGEWKWVFNRKADPKWGENAYESGWECSECGAGADLYISHEKVEESYEESEKGLTDNRTTYCHNCGAKMDLKEEEEKMIYYKDKSFCTRKGCKCTRCHRHYSNIPWDELPEYMGVSVADMYGKEVYCMLLPNEPPFDSPVKKGKKDGT